MEKAIERKFLSVKESIAYIQSQGYGSISDQTIREWCKNRGIGKKFGGRWVVHINKLTKLLEKGFQN